MKYRIREHTDWTGDKKYYVQFKEEGIFGLFGWSEMMSYWPTLEEAKDWIRYKSTDNDKYYEVEQ